MTERPRARYGSKEAELLRTAEMYVDLCRKDDFHLALWLVYDSNRYDVESLKYMATEVQRLWEEIN